MAFEAGDLPVAELMSEAVGKAMEGTEILFGSPALVINNSFSDGGVDRTGLEVVVPYFNSLGDWQEVPRGGGLDIKSTTGDVEKSVIRHVGISFSMTDWARKADSGTDPYEFYAKQMADGFGRKVGALALQEAIVTPPDGMLLDRYSASNPKTLDYDMVVDACGLWGDENSMEDGVVLGVSHSKVKTDIAKLKDANGRPLIADVAKGTANRLNMFGVDFGFSDRGTKDVRSNPAKYTTSLLKAGAIAVWYNSNLQIEMARDITVPATIAAVHMWVVVHRYRFLPGKTKSGVVVIRHN